jgi:hypothetical protein
MSNGAALKGTTPKVVKKKKTLDRDEDDEKPAKRGKITYARE